MAVLALLEQLDQARGLCTPLGLLCAVARLTDVLGDAPLDFETLADMRQRAVQPGRDLSRPIDSRQVASGGGKVLANLLTELDRSVAGLQGSVLRLGEPTATHEVLELCLRGRLRRLDIGVQRSDQHVDGSIGRPQIDGAIGRLALDEQLKAEAAPHVLTVPISVFDRELPLRARADELVEHPPADLSMLSVIALRRLPARIREHRLDHRLVRRAAIEVHLHGDSVDRHEGQPPNGVGAELAVSHSTLVRLQMMQRHGARHRLRAPSKRLIAKGSVCVGRHVRRQLRLEGKLHRDLAVLSAATHDVDLAE